MSQRFFFNSLTMTGEVFMIPAEYGDEWMDFDRRSEETCEIEPVPSWAVPVELLSAVEFEAPADIFADA